MVKKHKGGRRQILQLEDKKPTRNESEPTSTATTSKEASPLDSQVADFFKEIDALTVNEKADEGSSEAACSPSEVASCSKQKDTEDSELQDGLPDKSANNKADETLKESYCPWQEICDESTGYNYYWNVETNEVTWDCPSDYIIYLKNMQTTEFDQLPQLVQSNSNYSHKKSKKKKDPPLPLEGAIIPISYFGDTSSDESSDNEKENGLDTTSKTYGKMKAKSPCEGTQKNIKNEIGINHMAREFSVQAMGPHLPQDNHFQKKVSLSTKTSHSSKESESSKNEVEEYFEIGPQLPSNSQIELAKQSESNAVSDSSSKCNSVSYSNKNGPTVASTTYDEPWEVSLMNIDRKFRGLDPDVGEESPDSTVKKGDTMTENNVPCQTSNDICGLRGVVEYDNFTDEEEEMSSSNISSSKEESHSPYRHKSYTFMKPKDDEILYYGQRRIQPNKSEVSQSEPQQNLPKRKFLSKIDEYENFSFKKCKKNKIDFDSLFNQCTNSNKYGFGFSRQDQLNLESEFFCSTSNQLSSSKAYKDYKAINFVKSDHVFDLSTTINKNSSSNNNSGQSELSESEIAETFDNENIYKPGPSGLNGIRDSINSKECAPNSSCFQHSNELDFKEKCVERTNTRKDVSSSRANGHFRTEDTQEIDRNMLRSFEMNKNEKTLSKPSSSFPILSIPKCEPESLSCKKTNLECAKSLPKSGNLADDINNLSSIMIEKLTFLINHSTLTLPSSLLLQIQTRLIDWHAGALESKYFMARLQEKQQYLQHYEVGAVSGDWTCQWDRENKRYFYINTRTQQSQWTYPEELCGKENSWMPSSTDIASTSTSTASSEIMIEREELQTVSSSVPEGQLQNKSSVTFSAESSKGISEKYSDSSGMWLSESSPPPPPPGVDSPPPPPPHSPPPDSPPPPPPDSTEVEDCLEDMDIENSDDSNPPLILTNSRAGTPTDSHVQFSKFTIPSPGRTSENFTNASLTNAVSSTSISGFDDMNIVTKSPRLVSTSRDTFDNVDSVNTHWSLSQPSCSTDVASHFENENVDVSDHRLLSLEKESDISASSSSRNYVCSNEVSTYRQPSSSYPSSSSSSRKEKKKTKLSSGLALKKKNIPSLVEKWQKIKEQQEKEDKKDRNLKDPGN